jgi:deazaflavin-dependent oxidoreductase (nitroreductase family)
MRRRFLWLITNTLNRWTARLARAGRGPFSLVRHVGRKSGKPYETPIIVAPAEGGFIAELTYGENVDWYRNVVAAGGCELVVRGRPHRVVGVEPYPAEAGRRAFGVSARWVLKVLRRHEFRLLRTEG